MGLKARSLYFTSPGKIELREEEICPKDGQVLVHSRLVGISHGTEMLAYHGLMPRKLESDTSLQSLSGTLEYPLKYGYINTGVTEAGKRVFAFYPHQDVFYCVPEELIELPNELDFEDALFLATMETALGIVHDAQPRFGDVLLVIGQGVVGLLTAEILSRSSAGKIISVEPFLKRRRASGHIGCLALEPNPELQQRIFEESGGRGADIAINTSASAEGLQLAVDCLAFEGTVVEASWYGCRTVQLDLGSTFHRKRLRLRSSQVSRLDPTLLGRWDKQRRFEVVLELLKIVRPSRFVSHRFPFEKAQEAFELLDRSPEQTIQLVLEP